MNLVLADAKVGDKLYISQRLGANRIELVERITPTGRVVTGTGTFERNGYLRGERRSWHRTYARPATEDDIAGIDRLGLVRKIERFQGWDRLSADDLKLVAELVDRYAKP